jgi:hypothetical protein
VKRVLPATILTLLLAGCGADALEHASTRARAALRAGDGSAAEAHAATVAKLAGEAGASWRSFVRGNVAFARSLAFEAAAREGDREAFKAALRHAEDALAYWQAAAASRADWPAARRNVERALLRLRGLRERRGGGKDDAKRPPVEPEAAPPKPEPARKLEASELPPGQVLQVLERLRRREVEKLEVRRARRRARSADVERDW